METILYKAHPLSIEPETNLIELQCTQGQVWLTIEGYNEDFILSEGQRFLISKAQGQVVMESLANESRVQLKSFARAAA